MGPEYTADILEGLYKLIYTDKVLPALEQYRNLPISKDAKRAILGWTREPGFSLARAVAEAVELEANYLDGFYQENCKVLEIPPPPEELRLSTLYTYAPSLILVVEEDLRSGGIAEEGLKESLRRYGEEKVLTGDSVDIGMAEAHMILESWFQKLKQDPSGFSLIDGIVSGELQSQLVSIIREREMPYFRVIELGAERYKAFYKATST